MKRFLKWVLYAVIFLAAYYLITSLVGDFSTSVKFDTNDTITISGPRKTSVTVAYEDIDSIELVTLGDPGTAAGGGTSRSYYWGTWKNDEYGTYSLFVSKKSSEAILIKTKDGKVILFNQQDNPTTSNTFKLFEDLLSHSRKSAAAVFPV